MWHLRLFDPVDDTTVDPAVRPSVIKYTGTVGRREFERLMR